jgi:hypothetical protein
MAKCTSKVRKSMKKVADADDNIFELWRRFPPSGWKPMRAADADANIIELWRRFPPRCWKPTPAAAAAMKAMKFTSKVMKSMKVVTEDGASCEDLEGDAPTMMSAYGSAFSWTLEDVCVVLDNLPLESATREELEELMTATNCAMGVCELHSGGNDAPALTGLEPAFQQHSR